VNGFGRKGRCFAVTAFKFELSQGNSVILSQRWHQDISSSTGTHHVHPPDMPSRPPGLPPSAVVAPAHCYWRTARPQYEYPPRIQSTEHSGSHWGLFFYINPHLVYMNRLELKKKKRMR
jgi:hypothetical protein